MDIILSASVLRAGDPLKSTAADHAGSRRTFGPLRRSPHSLSGFLCIHQDNCTHHPQHLERAVETKFIAEWLNWEPRQLDDLCSRLLNADGRVPTASRLWLEDDLRWFLQRTRERAANIMNANTYRLSWMEKTVERAQVSQIPLRCP
jgi:hypothetical protein